MKKGYFILILMGMILGVILCLAANLDWARGAADTTDSEDVGLIDDDKPSWRVVEVLNKTSTVFKLRYVGYGCTQIVISECISGLQVTPPSVGDWCELTGHQKWNCGKNVQELRWRETLKSECSVYLPSLRKCPPCPVCPEFMDTEKGRVGDTEKCSESCGG